MQVRKIIYILSVALLAGQVNALADAYRIEILMGEPSSDAHIGSGWGHAEQHTPPSFRWLLHLEADIQIELDAVRDMELEWVGAAAHLAWRRQRIALYINGRFAQEWGMPGDPEFHSFRAEIPATYWREGTNRLTWRAAYRTRLGRSQREFAVAIHSIVLRAIDSLADELDTAGR